mgnify:CR=1 FL=1
MEIRNVLERLKLLTNDDREDLLLMLSGDAVQRLKARLCCTVEEENAHEEALCAAAAAQAAYQFWLLEEGLADDDHAAYFGEEAGGVLCKDCGVGGRVRLTAGEVRAEFDKGSERALAYAKQCERAVSGVLRDEDFYFGVTEDTV